MSEPMSLEIESVEGAPGYRIITRDLHPSGPTYFVRAPGGRLWRTTYYWKSEAQRSIYTSIRRAKYRAERKAKRVRAGIVDYPDRLRKAAYKAETAALGSHSAYSFDPGPEGLQAFAAKVWEQAFGRPMGSAIIVRYSRRGIGRRSFAGPSDIVLAPYHGLHILLHEMAHVITFDEQPAHGPRWAKAYVSAVANVIGKLEGQALYLHFEAAGLFKQKSRSLAHLTTPATVRVGELVGTSLSPAAFVAALASS